MAFKNWTKDGFTLKNLGDGGTTDMWTAGGSGTSEYYYNQSDLKHKPIVVFEGTTALTEGTIGSLDAGQYAWGDNDSIGHDVLYVRTSGSVDPDTLTGDNRVNCSDSYAIVTAGSSTTPLIFSRVIANKSSSDAATCKLILTDSSDVIKWQSPEFDIDTTTAELLEETKIVLNNSEKLKLQSSIEDISVVFCGME